MKKIFRRVLSLLLAAAMLCTWLPAGVGAHEPEMLDYSQADEIFDGLYRRIQSHKTPMDDARRAEAVEAYLENAEGVKPGTVRRMGNALTWEDLVVNITSYKLPNTGGSGTYFITFGGLLMIAVPCVYFVIQTERKKRRGGMHS